MRKNVCNRNKPRLVLAAALLGAAVPCLLLFSSCAGPAGSAPEQPANPVSTGSMALEDIPQSLREKLQKYPEAAEFVAAYPAEHNKHHVIDLSGECTPGEVPMLIQWDIRWGYEPYSGGMIGVDGCGPTCLSMALIGLTGDTSKDPLTVANFAEEHGFASPGKGSLWTLMSDGARQLGLDSEELPLDETAIRARLDMGELVVCVVGPGDFTDSGHFVLLTGINGDGTVSLRDPNSRNNSQRTWPLETIMHQTQNLWALSANGKN